jgi:hypothetical protein
MKFYRNILLLLLFAVINYYGIQYGVLGLDTPNLVFLASLIGLVLLAVADLIVIVRFIRNYSKKVEEARIVRNKCAEPSSMLPGEMAQQQIADK